MYTRVNEVAGVFVRFQQPVTDGESVPDPVYDDQEPGYGRLSGKVAIITGGHSGIGRAVSISYAKERADVVIVYCNEYEEARRTAEIVEEYGQTALLIAADLISEESCEMVIRKTIEKFGVIDILINNAILQYPIQDLESITMEKIQRVFNVNLFSSFLLVKYALPYLRAGCCIINTVPAADGGHASPIDQSIISDSMLAFTRRLSQSLSEKHIRVNAVVPGPALGKPAQPFEIATAYVFLGGDEGNFFTGQILYPNVMSVKTHTS